MIDTMPYIPSLKRGGFRQIILNVTSAWILHCEIYELPLESKYIPVSRTMFSNESTETAPKLELAHSINEPSSAAVALLKSALNEDQALDKVMLEIEKAIISQTVARHKTLTDACEALELSRSTFDARRRKHNL